MGKFIWLLLVTTVAIIAVVSVYDRKDASTSVPPARGVAQVQPTASSATSNPTSNPTSSINSYLENLGSSRPWQVFRGDNGQIQSVMGGTNLGVVRNFEHAEVLVQKLAPFFEVPAKQLVRSLRRPPPTATDIFEFKQKINELEVFDAKLTFVTNTETGEVIMINNSTVPLNPAPTQSKYKQEEALALIKSEYSPRTVKVINPEPKMVIWPKDSDGLPPELAWDLNVGLTSPSQSMEILVGAVSLKIRARYSKTIN